MSTDQRLQLFLAREQREIARQAMSDAIKAGLMLALEDELAALRVWLSADLPVDISDGIAISIDKLELALAKAKGQA